MTINSGPCQPWPVIWCDCNLTAASPAVTGYAVEAATEVLWALSGRRFGLCDQTVRPCRQDWASAHYGENSYDNIPVDWGSGWFGGTYYNVGCGDHYSSCSCTHVEQVILQGPVDSIVEIKIDGVVLDPSKYRLDDQRVLVRQDGLLWPLCQDFSVPAGAVGTWTVTFAVGEAVPVLGQMAVGELGCEFVKACVAPSECALPRRIADLTRQGVSVKFITHIRGIEDQATLLLLGLTTCAMFIDTVNPKHLTARSQVWSPDIPPPRYV